MQNWPELQHEWTKIENELVQQDNSADTKIDRIKKSLWVDIIDESLKNIVDKIPEDKLNAFMNQLDANSSIKAIDSNIILKELTEYFKSSVDLGDELELAFFLNLLPINQEKTQEEKKLNERKDWLKTKLNSVTFLQDKLSNDPKYLDFTKQQSEKIPNLQAQLDAAGVNLDMYLKLTYAVESNQYIPELTQQLWSDPKQFLQDFNKEYGIIEPLSMSRANDVITQTIDGDAFNKQSPDRAFDGVVTKSNDPNRKEWGFDNAFTSFEKDFFNKNSQLNTYLDKKVSETLWQSWIWGNGSSNTLQPWFEWLTANKIIDMKTITAPQLRDLMEWSVPAYNIDNIVKNYMNYFKNFDTYPPTEQQRIISILDAIIQKRFVKETQPVIKKLVAETYFAQVADLLKVWGQIISISDKPDAITYGADGSMIIEYKTNSGAKWQIQIMADWTVKVTDFFAKRGNTDTHDNENVIQMRERILPGKLQSTATMIDILSTQKKNMTDLWNSNAWRTKNSIDNSSYNTALITQKQILLSSDPAKESNARVLNASLQHTLESTKAFDATVNYLKPITSGNDNVSTYYTTWKWFLDKWWKDRVLLKPLLALRDTFSTVSANQVQSYTNIMRSLTGKIPVNNERQKDPFAIITLCIDRQWKSVDLQKFNTIADNITRTDVSKLKDLDEWVFNNPSMLSIVSTTERERIERKFEDPDAILTNIW